MIKYIIWPIIRVNRLSGHNQVPRSPDKRRSTVIAILYEKAFDSTCDKIACDGAQTRALGQWQRWSDAIPAAQSDGRNHGVLRILSCLLFLSNGKFVEQLVELPVPGSASFPSTERAVKGLDARCVYLEGELLARLPGAIIEYCYVKSHTIFYTPLQNFVILIPEHPVLLCQVVKCQFALKHFTS